ncbi:conserved hypothetical protein, partial [Ricinus communis]
MFVKSFAIALSLVLAGTGIASAQTKKQTQAAAPAAPAAPTRIQQFDAWGAYSYQSAGGK